MANPRVFISSTFYDLRQVREDLERFVREIGYEPIRNETGAIPYDKREKLETSAYREVELCDILVALVGGRYGTQSNDDPGYSISQAELRRALDRGIQVFIFVDRDVLSEYGTYTLNKGSSDIKYRFVDNVKVYEFIDQMYTLPHNNAIAPFGSSIDVIDYLRKQWAGLFQRFLQQQTYISDMHLIGEMTSAAKTLRELVLFLTEERTNKDDAIRNILLGNHPAFRRFADVTGTTYRVYFTNRSELDTWLKARSWTPIEKKAWDEDSKSEWINATQTKYIKLTVELFDKNGRLKVLQEDAWKPEWVEVLAVPDPSVTPA